MRLTALQLQRAVLCVQREAAEVHRAESRHSDPETPTHRYKTASPAAVLDCSFLQFTP